MNRLDFTLPQFVRISWVSDLARQVWEPRLLRITEAWLELEWLTVASGIRACGITTISPDKLVSKSEIWIKRGLFGLPLETQQLSNYNVSRPDKEKGSEHPFGFRVAVAKAKDLRFATALEDITEETVRLLGYPSCCFAFLMETFAHEGLTQFNLADRCSHSFFTAAKGIRNVELTSSKETNVLWRWLGIRAVPHLPCRFDCEFSRKLAKQFITDREKRRVQS